MSQLFAPPRLREFTPAGTVQTGAKLYFYVSGTTTPAAVYSDPDLDHPLSNPVVADTGGLFSTIWLDNAVAYDVTCTDSADAVQWTATDITSVTGDVASVEVIYVNEPLTIAQVGGVVTLGIDNVTSTTDGSMLAADKAKLDGATSAATASKLMARDSGGKTLCTATVSGDPATTLVTKGYAEALEIGAYARLLRLRSAATWAFPGNLSGTPDIITGFVTAVAGPASPAGNAPTTTVASGVITATKAGAYLATFTAEVIALINAATVVGCGFYINGVLSGVKEVINPGNFEDDQSITFTQLLVLAAADVVTVRWDLLAGPATTPTIDGMTFAIMKIAPT